MQQEVHVRSNSYKSGEMIGRVDCLTTLWMHQTVQPVVSMINLKGWKKEHLWCNLMYFNGNCLEGLRKNTKYFRYDILCPEKNYVICVLK
jgi:hypothetical protein